MGAKACLYIIDEFYVYTDFSSPSPTPANVTTLRLSTYRNKQPPPPKVLVLATNQEIVDGVLTYQEQKIMRRLAVGQVGIVAARCIVE